MDMKIFPIVAVIMSILLLGCTGTQQQSASQQPAAQLPAQNMPAINDRTGANVVNPPAQNQPASNGYTCALNLSPSTINAGESTEIEFSLQSDRNRVFTYNCGNEITSVSTGGLTSGFKLCKFNTPGNVEVWIKTDGILCAQKTLVVQQASTPKTCYIDQGSVTRDLVNYDYKALVHYSGFTPQDEIKWVCDYTTSTQVLGGSSPTAMPVYMNIECNYADRPIMDSITVSIGGVSCGSISTR